ncbi:MAG: flagellar basal body-associated FliL family protein, partial [Gammaproteobacteria bacterium]|nr:flagellar basal body-associated FliL family protein [Gammaproteobacteria bacterium]
MAKEKIKDEDENEEKKDSGGSMKLIVIILGVLLLVVIGVGVALFMMMGDKEPAAVGEDGEPVAVEEVQEPRTPIYVALHPAFLANFEDQSSASYLQADVQIMTYDEEVEKAVQTHMPKIRNDLLWLFGSQKFEELNTV